MKINKSKKILYHFIDTASTLILEREFLRGA